MLNPFVIFGLGGATGSALTLGVIKILNKIDDIKTNKAMRDKERLAGMAITDNKLAIYISEKSKEPLVLPSSSVNKVDLGNMPLESYRIDPNSCLTISPTSTPGAEKTALKTDYRAYYVPATVEEFGEAPEWALQTLSGEESDPTIEDVIVQRFVGMNDILQLEALGKVSPENYVHCTYYTYDGVLVRDNERYAALALGNLFIDSIAESIELGDSDREDSGYMVYDSESHEVYFVKIVHGMWSDSLSEA